MKINPKIDALQLMLTDLRTRNEPIRHKAAFKGCQPEFQALVARLIKQLEDELNSEKLINRDKQVKHDYLNEFKQSCLACFDSSSNPPKKTSSKNI